MPDNNQDQANAPVQGSNQQSPVPEGVKTASPTNVSGQYPPSSPPAGVGSLSSTPAETPKDTTVSAGSPLGQTPSEKPTTQNVSIKASGSGDSSTSPAPQSFPSTQPLGTSKGDKDLSKDPLSSSPTSPTISNEQSTTSGLGSSTSSILEPKDNDEKSVPTIIPGTPGNQISPPMTDPTPSGIKTPTPNAPPTLGGIDATGRFTTPASTSASGQPLNTDAQSEIKKPADLSDTPLKSPPMPGALIPEEDKKEDDDDDKKGTPPSPSTVISSTDSESGGKFKFFVILLVVVTIIVYGVVAFLYFTGDSEDNLVSNFLGDSSSNQETSQSENTNNVAAQNTPTPTPTITNAITINNGDVVSESSLGDVTVLVKKNDYPGSGIVGFSKVIQSPDKAKLCFYSLSPADDPSLYLSNSDGTSVEIIQSNVASCLWSDNSSKLAYTNSVDAISLIDIYMYDLDTKESTNLTSQTADSDIFRRYEIEEWTKTDTKMLCNYVEIDTQNTNEETLGKCEIDIASSEALDL